MDDNTKKKLSIIFGAVAATGCAFSAVILGVNFFNASQTTVVNLAPFLATVGGSVLGVNYILKGFKP